MKYIKKTVNINFGIDSTAAKRADEEGILDEKIQEALDVCINKYLVQELDKKLREHWGEK